MKKLSMLLTVVFTLVIVSGAFAQFTQSEDVNLNMSVTFSSGTFSFDIVDSTTTAYTTGDSIIAADIVGAGVLEAGGTDNVLIAKVWLDAETGGTYEIVTYTDNITNQSISYPTNWATMLPAQQEAWVGERGGLQQNAEYFLPLKVRSEVDAGANTQVVGDSIAAIDFTGDAAVYGYVTELANETVLGGTLKVLAATPAVVEDSVKEVAFGINEAAAADGAYSTTIYFELRHN